ncbi:uncharacterized protein [Argopecten irradians]|uniref:uncharacterized protein n=1 Tax=Argopecten irradians TaxID=31199 RepID=UPI003723C6CD
MYINSTGWNSPRFRDCNVCISSSDSVGRHRKDTQHFVRESIDPVKMAKYGCFKFAFFLTQLCNLSDFIMDWVFYGEIKNAEDGLVFGRQDKVLVDVSLVFCCIGTATFIIELILDILKYKWSTNPYECDTKRLERVSKISDVMSVVTLVIEDLPQVLINFAIALCREEVTNIVQILKASSSIIEVVIAVIIMLATFCRTAERGRLSKCCFFLTLILSLIILGFSAAVFYLEINFDTEIIHFDSDGFKGSDADRYLLGVVVFMQSPVLVGISSGHWLNVTSVKSIMGSTTSESDIHEIGVFATSQKIWIKKTSPFSGESLSCYNVIHPSITSTLPLAQCPSIPPDVEPKYIRMQLSYVKPTRKKPFGDIIYNYSITDQNCVAVSPQTLELKYFKWKEGTQGNQTFVRQSDLHNIRDVWETGRAGCKSTARERPKLSPSITVSCTTRT